MWVPEGGETAAGALEVAVAGAEAGEGEAGLVEGAGVERGPVLGQRPLGLGQEATVGTAEALRHISALCVPPMVPQQLLEILFYAWLAAIAARLPVRSAKLGDAGPG